ncbi:MAG: AAA domain-containing protein [Chloroflexi bacterium]|nr:AAA domain-containing protein [Chloroflexota bacterium]
MISERKLQDLIALLKRRYPDWVNFDHPGFVDDEIAYKQATSAKARELLSQTEMDRLIAAGEFEELWNRLVKLCRDNNLLFRRVPSQGDTAVLHHPDLDKASLGTAVRNLLHSDHPSPVRLQTFSDYCAAHELPNKWPFPTYLLFIAHPNQEMFVKPRAAGWFLKFMGVHQSVTAPPTAVVYAAILEQAQNLYDTLLPYDVHDFVDVQGFLWVCHREGKERVGRLNAKGQVDLDVPPTKPLPPTQYEIMQETPVLSGDRRSQAEAAVLHEPRDNGYNTMKPEYPLSQCAAETGYGEDELAQWAQAIERKGQAIFYGPPGTGKTFMAEKMARHLIGGGDGFTELIQFHPAYAYEDFIQGIRPFTRDGAIHYEMVPGQFMQFCERTGERNGRCLLIVDEINRANIASVFGELMYLLEYRDRDIPLAGGGRFRIPANVRILGTMNTADRSIALVDHALRRRFAFIHLPPNYNILRRFHQDTGYDVNPLLAILRRLNAQIADPHYYVGTTFFLRRDLAAQLEAIWRMEIEPYLEEYFFDQHDTVESFRWGKLGLTAGD